MTGTKTRAAIYARISISDPNTPKVENQLADLHKYAKGKDYAVIGEYVDDGLSAAKAENRPDFDRLMADLQAGKIDTILATEDARLARNNIEKGALTMACVSAGATWQTLRDGFTDPATASGEFMAVIRGAVDTLESKRKAERQRTENGHRREDGIPQPGQRPFGWEIVGKKPFHFESIAQEQALARWGIEMLLSGVKPYAIVKAWNQTGILTGRGNAWTQTSVVSVLRRWRNAAWTEHQGEPVAEGNWEPICTRAELEKVRTLLTATTSTGWRQPVGICSGLARCVCGEPLLITGYAARRVYRCTTISRPGRKEGRHVQIPMAALDALARKGVIASYFVTAPDALPSHDADAANLAELYDKRAEAQGRIGQIQDDREAGLYTRAEAARRIAKHRVTVEQIERQITDYAARSAHARMLVEARSKMFGDDHRVEIADAAKVKVELGERFDALDLEQQRSLVAAMLRVTVHPGRGDDRVDVQHVGAQVLDAV